MSAFRGEADGNQPPSERPLVATSRHRRRVIGNRNVDHRDADGGSRPPHQYRTQGLARYRVLIERGLVPTNSYAKSCALLIISRILVSGPDIQWAPVCTRCGVSVGCSFGPALRS